MVFGFSWIVNKLGANIQPQRQKLFQLMIKFWFIFLDKLWWSLGWLKKYVTSFVKWVTYKSTPFCPLLLTIECTQQYIRIQQCNPQHQKYKNTFGGPPFCSRGTMSTLLTRILHRMGKFCLTQSNIALTSNGRGANIETCSKTKQQAFQLR